MSKKGKKTDNVGKKIIRFFGDIRSELKKVIWPDRKKLVQSTITVISICLIMAALVYSIDKVLSASLNAVGFFPEVSSVSKTAPVSVPGISIPEIPKSSDEKSEDAVSNEVSEDAQSSTETSQENSKAD